MPINLNSVVTQLLTPDVIAQIASFLGIGGARCRHVGEARD
jgi:hypothetical protein